MYFNFFGLRTRPFNTTPDPEFLYLSPGHKQALGSIIYGVKEKKGFIAVTAQVGLGKTTILRSSLAQFDQANQHTIYLLNPNLSFTSLLKSLLRELGHDPIEGNEAEVVEQLHMVLIEEYRKGKTVVLLIDEAQNMPVETLEHLRMLSNLETPKDKLIQIVLLGPPELDDILDRYELRQIRQRIAVRATIRPLTKKECVEYIRHRLDMAGGKGKNFFTNAALALIVEEAEGIPRRLNILCDNALVTAFGYEKTQVTATMAKEVINDLTGRPSPSLWKLVPLGAGSLILVLALVWLMPLTHSQILDIPPLHEIGQLVEEGENRNQSLLNEETITPSAQDGLTLTERAQTFLTESVPEALEELQILAISHLDSNTTPPDVRTDIDPPNQGDLVLAKKPQVELKNSAPVASKESEEPAVPETATPIFQSLQEIFDLSSQGEGMATDEAHLPPIEGTQVVQDGTETRSADATGTNPVHPNPEKKFGDHTVQSVVQLVEEPKSSPTQDIPHSVTVATNLETPQENPSQKPEVGASPLPVTRIVKKGDTMAKLLKDVYGSASPSTVRFVLEHNRHIVGVRKMYPGQQIMFPPLESVESKKTVAEAEKPLVSVKNKDLHFSKKIFARSSAQTKPNEINVEAKRESPYAVATVQEGDTLEKLVKIVYGSPHPRYIQRVLDYNPKILNPKKIFPGQDIAFPKITEKVKSQASE